MPTLRLRLELEIDTSSHAMRVIDQRVSDGMPTVQLAPEQWPLCAIEGCEQRTAKITGKYCGREHFGLARTGKQIGGGVPGRTSGTPRRKRLVVDAVTGVIRSAPVTVTQIGGPDVPPTFTTFSFGERLAG
jgi:hypothetical protein